MKLPAYPKYKPSGLEWLGDVPVHWQLKRISGLFRFRSGGTPSTDNADYWSGLIPWVSAKDMRSLRLSDTEDHITEEAVQDSATTVVPEGSLLILTRSGILKHTLPVAVNQKAMAVNQDVKGCLLSKPDVDSLYCAYLLQGNQDALLTLWRQQGATVDSLDFETVKVSKIPLPPCSEQRAITDFLDAETAKLDTLVGKKRELIEKLKEKRSALISRTVTRGLPPEATRAAGLNPHPKLKPSGIEWLGEIPEHWDVCKFSREVRVAEGQVDPEIEPYSSMLLIAPNHIESATGRLLAKETAAEQGAESGKYLCRAGEVIYSKIRPALAKVIIAPEDCLCSADMYPLSGSHRFESRYICWLFLSQQFTAWSVLESDRVAMPKINRETFSELRMPVPALSEQRSIADYLDQETAKIDRMMEKVEAAIERLQEYRTALITAAVTGKIDVRGYVRKTEAA